MYPFHRRAPIRTENERRRTIDPIKNSQTTLLIQNQKIRNILDNERSKNKSQQRTILQLRRKINQFKKRVNQKLAISKIALEVRRMNICLLFIFF